jgi:hypothetical protein
MWTVLLLDALLFALAGGTLGLAAWASQAVTKAELRTR